MMQQAQFEQLLAWVMLSAMNSQELLMQSQLGHELTEQERTKCHKDAHKTAELLRQMFSENRKQQRTPVQSDDQ